MSNDQNQQQQQSVVFSISIPYHILTITPDGQYHWHPHAEELLTFVSKENPSLFHTLAPLYASKKEQENARNNNQEV